MLIFLLLVCNVIALNPLKHLPVGGIQFRVFWGQKSVFLVAFPGAMINRNLLSWGRKNHALEG